MPKPMPNTLTVKLFATLRRGRFDRQTRQYPPGTTVKKILDDLNIPTGHASIIFVNHRHATLDQELKQGDELGIFPPLGGG